MEDAAEVEHAWNLVARAVADNENAYRAMAGQAQEAEPAKQEEEEVKEMTDDEEVPDDGLAPRRPKRPKPDLVGQSVLEEVQAYRKVMEPAKGVTTLQWWRANEQVFPRVARWARVILSMPASSAPSERVFSKVNIVVQKRTNRLDARRVERRVFMKHNLLLFDHPHRPKA